MSRPEPTVRFLPVAEEDLGDIVSFVAAENPRAADALAEAFERNLRSLARHPRMGAVPGDEVLVRMGYRFLVIEDYLAFYTIEDDDVIVHRIVHGARDYLSLL